ncbi:MAG: transporter substrate-binding domain-containing protein [Hydrogenophilales bacterium]|nr:transporter substrate-binding domain-containing protein [Hydrogenophilales bacterium]
MRDFAQRQHRRQSEYIRSCVWLSCVLLALALNGNASHGANEPTLVINDTNEPPFTTQAGDGFLDIVAGEAFRRAGLRLKLVKLPAERALLNVNAGIEDGDFSRIAGLEKIYPNLIRVPEKLVDWHFVAFARQATLIKANWTALEPLSVGHIKGWKIYEQNLRPATQITTVGTPEQLFAMLDKNRIDLALFERWSGLALAKKMGIQNIRIVEPSLAEREMFIYLNKRHADKVPAIAAALRAIKAEGLYTKVCREKFAPLAASTSQCEMK